MSKNFRHHEGQPLIVEFFWECWSVLTELAPWFLLGAAIAGLLHGLLPADFIRRKLRGRWGVVKAVLIGVPLPLCSCGVVPAGIGLRRDGASRGSAVGFLTSTPQTGIDSILVSATFLGLPFAIFKVFSAAIMGFVGGWLTDWLDPEEQAETTGRAVDRGPAMSVFELARGMLSHGIEIIDSVRYWLLFGVAISAAISTVVPPQWLASLQGLGVFGSSLMALAISIPLYVCATASVPIGAALVTAGFPTGATLVFLMAGPATNVATVGSIYREFGSRTLVIYLSTIVIGSLVLAQVFEWLIAADSTSMPDAPHLEHLSWLSHLSAGAMAMILFLFMARDLRRRIFTTAIDHSASTATFSIGGMHCQACVTRLENSVLQVQGVLSANIQLKSSSATVAGEFDPREVIDAIQSAGYTVADDS